MVFMLSAQQRQTQDAARTASMRGTVNFPTTPSSIDGLLWFYRLTRLGIGAVFVWSGVSKLLDPQSFAIIIESYGLIPEITVFPTAMLLSAIELAAGLGLIFDLQYTLGLITGLLVLFMLILGYGLWMGLDVDCGCFGPEDPETEAYHGLRPALYRDLVMLAGIGYLYYHRRRQSISPLTFSTVYKYTTKRR